MELKISPYGFYEAVDDNKVIGIIKHSNTIPDEITKVETEPKSLYLSSLHIYPDYRGNGYGKETLRLFEEEMINDGFRNIYLVPVPTNLTEEELITFYKKSGYSELSHIGYGLLMKKKVG